MVKIHTLGRFAVALGDQPLRFATKAQKKPLELLKALIALGGHQVREERVAELLWPEAENAECALKSTAHRLRKLIGAEALVRGEGRLTLNSERCWTDLWCIEAALEDLESACRKVQVREVEGLCWRALTLYRGPFLESEPQTGWAVSARERLNARVVRDVEAAAGCLERARVYEQAIDCYRAVLEIDTLAEPLYRGLIRCYLDQGRHAEALQAYERCYRMLGARLSVRPSPATRMLVQSLRRHPDDANRTSDPEPLSL
jgi:DNA-binding SARP family transcriptional activator